ncbi:MAG: tetratricopeptide repeat protein, partial [Leptolyngbya sp.]|nr:tetratricopeptide repeat protein [Candidatus Melainabacteria bacterium]
DYTRAQKIFEKASELFPANQQDDAMDALFHVGYDYNHLGEFSKAQPILQKVVDSKKLYYKDRPKTLRALGVAYEGLKNYSLAELYLNQSIDEAVKAWGAVNSNVAFSQGALGRVKIAQGNKVEGQKLAEYSYKFFAGRRKSNQYDYNDAKLNLANIYRDNGKFAEARGLYDALLKDIADDDYAGPASDFVVRASDLLRKQSGK